MHMESAARRLLGDPNRQLSSQTELRFGKQGSLAVDLDKGTFFDHELKEGGGVLDLIARETGERNGAAVEYLKRELGADIPDNRSPMPPKLVQPRKQVAAYDYADETGDLLFQVVRFEPKDFRQRRPDTSAQDGWNWSIKGVRQVPYRLPEIIEAAALGQTIFIAEGEKDVDSLWRIGVPATCNAGGAGKWPDGLSEHLKGCDVVILPDNDDAGRNHVQIVGKALQSVASTVRVLNLPGLGPKDDVSDWIDAGGSVAALHIEVEAKARPWAAGAPVSAFGAIIWSALDSVTVRQDWLVEDLIFAGDFGLVYGASQSGKSFLAVDMGLAIARGEPFLGKKTSKGSVIYQAGEGGKGLLRRLKAYRHHHDIYADDLPFVLLPGRIDLFQADAENGIEPFIAEIMAFKTWLPEPLGMVFIDTYSTATPGANENASEDVSKALRAIQRIQDAARCGVMVVHHKNAGGEKPRGHTSLYANADTALEVIRDENDPSQRTLRIAKVKDGEDGEAIGFTLQSVTIGAHDDGKPMTSCVVVPAQAQSRTGKSKSLPHGQAVYLSCLDDAITQSGGLLPPTVTAAPRNVTGVDYSHFRTIYTAVQGVTLDDNALRQALKRNGEALYAKGLIGKDNPWVWITDHGRRQMRGGA